MAPPRTPSWVKPGVLFRYTFKEDWHSPSDPPYFTVFLLKERANETWTCLEGSELTYIGQHDWEIMEILEICEPG